MNECAGLRNFCAHGGSAGRVVLEPSLVGNLLKKFAAALNNYWNSLVASGDENARTNLAKAAVTPLFASGSVIHVPAMLKHVSDGTAVGDKLLFSDRW